MSSYLVVARFVCIGLLCFTFAVLGVASADISMTDPATDTAQLARGLDLQQTVAPADTQRISFAAAVAIALQQNTDIARAVNAEELERAAVTQAKMQFLPDLRLGLSASQSYSRDTDSTGLASGWNSNGSVRGGLSSGVVLFDGFANVASLQGAGLGADASQQETERVRQTVVFTIITGYLTMIEAHEQVRVREEDLAAQQKQEELVDALVAGGERPVSDLYQQQASVAAARLALVEAKNSYDLSRVDLVQALQLDPARDYEFEIPPLPSVSTAEPPVDRAALLAQAFELRPDLRAQDLLLRSAGKDEQVAASGWWPTLSLSGDYGTSYRSETELGFHDEVDRNQSASVGLSLSLPLFDRLDTKLATERARIGVRNAELAVLDLRQAVALQVRRAVLDRDAAIERLAAAEAREAASAKALESTQQRYSAGAATLYEVTLARADYVAATSESVSARYNLLWQKRLLDYYVGDLEPDEPLL